MKRVQVYIKTSDLEDKIKTDCSRTGLTESQWLYLILNKYYYDKDEQKKKDAPIH